MVVALIPALVTFSIGVADFVRARVLRGERKCFEAPIDLEHVIIPIVPVTWSPEPDGNFASR